MVHLVHGVVALLLLQQGLEQIQQALHLFQVIDLCLVAHDTLSHL